MSPPPWVSVLKSQLKSGQEYTTYALATLSTDGLPRVRHVIHRAITPASSLLISTTDLRMRKTHQLSHNPSIEIAWWLQAEGIQFRILGKGHVVPPFNSSDSNTTDANSDTTTVLEALSAQGPEASPSWWETERHRLWKDAMSGHLRASFARPEPGKPLDEVEDEDQWPESIPAESDDPKEAKIIKTALSNFALVAIKVDEFEFLELKPVPNRRTIWKRKSSAGGDEWEKVRVAP